MNDLFSEEEKDEEICPYCDEHFSKVNSCKCNKKKIDKEALAKAIKDLLSGVLK